MSPPNPSVELVDVSPRDGLQNEPVNVSTSHKVELIKRLADAGVRRVEAVSFVSPKAVPQMADAEAVMEGVRNDTDVLSQGVIISGLALNERGTERALKAGVDEINFVVIASETFNQRNQGASIEKSLRDFENCCALTGSAGVPVSLTVSAAFGCPFEGEVSAQRVLNIAVAGRASGAVEIALADTIGVADPMSVERVFQMIKEDCPDIRLRGHFHDTRNTAIANAVAALRAGAVALDTSVGGIGGCPFAPAATGNLASEDLVYVLDRMKVENGLDLENLRSTAAWLQDEVLRNPVPSALLRAGGFPHPKASSDLSEKRTCDVYN